MTRGWLPQRAGLPSLNGGGTATVVGQCKLGLEKLSLDFCVRALGQNLNDLFTLVMLFIQLK